MKKSAKPKSSRRTSETNNERNGNLGFEAKLWSAADLLRSNMDPAEYKHVVLGLLFLKYISDAFEERREWLRTAVSDKNSDYHGEDPEDLLEDRDEYAAENVFWVPLEARWEKLQANATQPTIGKLVDDAMDAIERENQTLKGVLPKIYAMPGLDKQNLGKLIDLVSGICLGSAEHRAKDTLGRVYEYFLARFASAEGKGGGEFYTPTGIVRLLVEMIEPYSGRVYDPCCGSGGMFVQSLRFIEAHGGNKDRLSVYGQESNHTTWRLARMNLAIRGIEANLGRKHADSFREDLHPDLRADFILANPPFNISEWHGETLRDDVRWKYGIPPVGNANYAWVQHFVHHLAPGGVAGFVLANGSMSTNTSGEGEIRKNLIEANMVDCIIALPGQLFYATPIPVCLWFIRRNKSGEPSSPTPFSHGAKGSDHFRGNFDFSGLVENARKLRKKQTFAEEILWEMVRDRRFMGLKFRRQHQFGPYILDFYCDAFKLVVELDGAVHGTESRAAKDHKRDEYLRSMGLMVVRLQNQIVLDNPEDTLTRIQTVLNSSPSGRGGVRVNRFRARRGETLFIDARKKGSLIDRTHRELSEEEIAEITRTYHAWRGDGQQLPSTFGRGAGGEGTKYKDKPGFCKSATLDDIRSNNHILTPGRYVGAEAIEDDGVPFEEKMAEFSERLYEQMKESKELDAVIRKNLEVLGYGE